MSVGPDPVHTVAQDDPAVTTGFGGPAPAAAKAMAGARYVLGAEIARGGMGAVYRATDTALDREVAVKVLQERFGPNSGAARRFLDEARITGQLQHPGIPPVHDAGTLPDGRPFLAMKLIKGDTLDQLLKSRPDPAHDRGRFVAVFEQICQAVGYAHSRGVIHRDLKPQNVMVGGFGETQVMDWGLAKVLSGGTGADPEASTTGAAEQIGRDFSGSETVAGSVLGTPAYMPPEQARGEVEQVNARSDVFGLAAILSVILTGKPPFVSASAETTRMKAARGELAECLTRLDGSGADPELVALCKRCLSPRREDRPADAGAVAMAVGDLRTAAEERARQAELDRVKAEGEKAAAELKAAEGKKRRRVWYGLAGALAAGLVAATTLAILADRSRRAANDAREAAEQSEGRAEARRVEADTKRREAEDQTALAKGVKDFLQYDVLMLADPAKQQEDKELAYDADVRLRDVVLRGAKAIEGKFGDRPLVEAELRCTLGHALIGMGRADLAITQFERAWDIYKVQFGPDHADTLLSMSNLSISYATAGRLSDALRLEEQELAICKAKFGTDHPDTLTSMNNLSVCYAQAGRAADALLLREEVLARRKAKLGLDHPDTLLSMSNLACSYREVGRVDDALRLSEEVLTLQTAKLGRDHPDSLSTMSSLANNYREAGRLAAAHNLGEELMALCKAKLGTHHPATLHSMDSLAASYRSAGRLADALRLREDVLALRKANLGPDHPDTLQSMNNVAASYADAGRPGEAVPLFRAALAGCRKELGPNHPRTNMYERNLARAERDQSLLARLPAILAGADQPSGAGEAAEFANLCRTPNQNRFMTAVSLYERAFTAAPLIANVHQYDAGCAAARAARGDGIDAPTIAADRATVRAKSFDWLRTRLLVWQRLAGSRDQERRRIVANSLANWLENPDLSATRPGLMRIGLPAAERAQWDQLWADVRATLAEAQKPAPPPEVAPVPRVVGTR